MVKTILVTGGAGFIGSHLVRHFVKKYPDYRVICFDALTYAGNMENLKDISIKPNYVFVKGDIRYVGDVRKVFDDYNVTDVIHLAAESHVDRSINDPTSFVTTNVLGTVNLLNACREYWADDYSKHRFHHVSTDEVYGTLEYGTDQLFSEDTPYSPHSPYSASKAGSDHFVKAYHDTYGMNTTISNCSNNYGPNQFPEKLIPLAISCLMEGKKIPVYGKGENIRDWLYVEDHVKAIDVIFHNGKNGETYNIGGKNEIHNIDIVKKVIEIYEYETVGAYNINFNDFIEYVEDRKGHDLRYAIDPTKIEHNLNWTPDETFNTGIVKTVKWYIENKEWIKHIKDGTYQEMFV